MSDKSLDKYFVHTADGQLNKQATLQKFEVAMEERNAYLCETIGKVSGAMNAVFEAHKGVKLNVQFIIGSTMRALEPIKVEDYTETQGHCNDYLQMLKATGQVTIVKGPKGGVTWNAVPVLPTAKDAAEGTSDAKAERKSLAPIEISTASGKPEVVEPKASETDSE